MNIRIFISAIMFFMFILLGKIYYDTYTIEVRHYRITDTRLSDAIAGKKIAFISDLHAETFGPREKEVISILEREKPDFVLLGGDYISFRGPYEPALLFLDKLQNAYAVLGNTEYTNENGSCIFCHEEKSPTLKKQQKIPFLRNVSLTLKNGTQKFNLVGLDGTVSERGSLEDVHKVDHTLPTILLAHSPEIFEDAVNNGIDFVLCGHNHGGQVFFARYLKGAVLVDPCFDYLEGFFQKGNTLMYVSRGVGNSFLPFRLGVMPEVVFFEFAKNNSAVAYPSGGITNKPMERISAGFSIANLSGLFDFSNHIRKTYKTGHRIDQSGKLFDFESEAEIEYLDWECHKWFELSNQHATSGKHSLQVTLPTGQYPGIYFKDIEKDWSGYHFFKIDLFNPSEPFTFHIRIDDKKSGWEYADRFDRNFKIQKGMNHISIPLESVKANITPRALNLSHIKRLMLFVPDNDKKRTLYLDNIRLE
jgi:predicted MPP superfamily phosphohydrolase